MYNRAMVKLSFTKKALLAVTGTATLVVPVVAGIHTPSMHAQSRPALPSPATIRPKFEVASIKACGEAVGLTRSREGGGNRRASPGTLDELCQTVRTFIQVAYIRANFRANGGIANLQLEGGPAWIDSDRYQITAKAQGPTDQQMMEGPMLQELLEDRFQLKTHRETREARVSALTVA